MRLYLLRHGETQENCQGVLQGQQPGTLSPLGLEQISRVAQRLATERFDYIYTSDLRRAADTARAVAQFHPDTPFILEPRLRERDLGEWELQPVSVWDAANMPSSVESDALLLQRASSLVADLYERHAGQQVLCVSHGSIGGRIVEAITGQRPQELCGKPLANTSLCIFELSRDGHSKVLLNCTAHLD